MTTDERIARAGWFKGTERDWQWLTKKQREDAAFAAVGCAVAYPTWEGPVDCVHTGCQIRRGEIPPICETNRILRYEMERGWLRFGKETAEGRVRLGRLCKAIRHRCRETGTYDPWKLQGGWQALVSAGIAG